MGNNSGERPRRGRPRDPDAEPRIRRYAVQLLLERGFDGMTVDDVAEAAGVGKATIYRRWASKELLANDAMAQLFDIEIPDADTGSIAGDLRQVYRDALTFVNSQGGRRADPARRHRDEPRRAVHRVLPGVPAAPDRLDGGRSGAGPAAAVSRSGRGADPVLMVQWLAGVLIVRAMTGEADAGRRGRRPPGRDDDEVIVEG